MARKIVFRSLFVLYLAAIVYLCFGTFQGMESVPRNIFGFPTDKAVHFAMYLPFVPLAYLATASSSLLSRGFGYRLAALFGLLLVAALIGASIEFFQGLTPHRSSEMADFVADCIGACCGFLPSLLIKTHKK